MLPELKEQEARERIASIIASELEDGSLVNLGIGIPQLVPNFVPQNVKLILQTENGVIMAGLAAWASVSSTSARNGCPSADCTRRRPNPSAYALPATQVNNTVAIATLEIRKRINGVFPSAAVRLDLVQFFIAGSVVIANSWNLASCCQA